MYGNRLIMTREELPAWAATMQRAITSSATCTAATVESLRSVLLPAETPKTVQRKTPANKSLPTAKRAVLAKVEGRQGRKKPVVAIIEVPADGYMSIGIQERATLAIQVVNSTLKALTEAIKNASGHGNKTPLKRKPSNTSSNNGVDLQGQPLQPISVNRLAKTTEHKAHLRRSSCTVSHEERDIGLIAQAECCRTALAALRLMQGRKDALPMPHLQVESGMSALIGKLISLRFPDMAVKELRILRRRLESSSEPGITKATRDLAKAEKTESKAETLADMLRFHDSSITTQLLPLVVTSQLQALKLLALKNEAYTTESALPHIRPDAAHSPVNLIQRQIEFGSPVSREKVAQQMESLAQCIDALCPRVSTAEGHRVSCSSQCISPDTAFEFQLLALQIRSIRWKISSQELNKAMDVVEPFSRCLSTFHRRSKTDTAKKYKTALSAFGFFSGLDNAVTDCQKQELLVVYDVLIDLAQNDSNDTEAVNWLQKSIACARHCGISQTRLCSLYCRLATFQVRAINLASNDDLLHTLTIATSGLEGHLEGESAELDQLLLNVANLRKSSYAVVRDDHTPTQDTRVQNPSVLVDKCSETVLLCLKFVLRYIGSNASQRGNDKTAARHDQRRQQAAKVSKPIIESVTAMARLGAKNTQNGWKRIEAGLRDCSSLAIVLEDIYASDVEISKVQRRNSVFVSISNAYWYLHLQKSQASDDENSSSKNYLQSSIDLLKDRQSWEKQDGRLSMKLEKYAHLCESMRDYKGATGIYRETIKTQIELGLLQSAKKAVEIKSLPSALEDDKELRVLHQALTSYTKNAFKANTQGMRVYSFFDDERLCREERGVLLEQQLIALLVIYKDHGPSPSISPAINILTKAVFAIYINDAYPVRRLRVVVRLLGLVSSSPDVLDEELQEILSSSPLRLQQDHSDLGLLKFFPHLCATRDVFADICQRTLGPERTREAVAIWSKMLHECSNWEALHFHVYDVSDWLSQLELVAAYLDMQGLEMTRISVLHVVATVYELANPFQLCSSVSKLSALGLQYTRLGYSGMAGAGFHKAWRYLETSEVPGDIQVRWHISHAEHSVSTGNLTACKHNLDRAHELFGKGLPSKDNQRRRSRDQSESSQLIADACHLQSLLAIAEGRSFQALYFARLSVKNNQRAWAILNKSRVKSDSLIGACKDESLDTLLAHSLSELSIKDPRSTEQTAAHTALNKAAFWGLVPRLFRGFVHLSQLLAYHGLFTEIHYYLGQAQRIAEVVQAPSLIGRHALLLGQYSIDGGEYDQGARAYQTADRELAKVPPDLYYIGYQLAKAEYQAKLGRAQEKPSGITLADQALNKLMTKTFLDELIHKQPVCHELVSQFNSLEIQETRPAKMPHNKARRLAPKKPQSSKRGVQRDVMDPLAVELSPLEATVLHQRKAEVLRGRLFSALCEGDINLGVSLLDKVIPSPDDQQGSVLQAVLTSQIRYRQELDQLMADPIFCVLAESTISCPSTKAGDQRQQHHNGARKCQIGVDVVSSRSQHGKGLRSKTRPGSPSTAKSEVSMLQLAQDVLIGVYNLARRYSPTNTLHKVTSVLGKISMMLSATSAFSLRNSVSPIFLVYILEMGKILSVARGSTAIRVEQNLLQSTVMYDWPKNNAGLDEEKIQPYHEPEVTNFQANYIDIIPSNWIAISMTLSESREEILICRVRAGQSPLVLRLPLSRSDSLEADEESFDFDHGKAELQEIIRLTNDSTHGAQDLSRKGAKTQWWEDRTALDARLKDLLVNIENIWLAGFKGIFAPDVQDQGFLARFEQSLQNILNKHLPSRQKPNGSNHTNQVKLDLRVIELFVGLGMPSDTHDIDEPLMDLLYFVVDILQFNGERNAYDEIDLDSIAIETTDALRQYHQALTDVATSRKDQHTILILDKHLHCFPWESLPCLSGHAISRLPSLGCLRDRILRQMQSSRIGERPPSNDSKSYVSRNNGTSILNPGGDLKATQLRFEDPLRNLAGWSAIIQREPEEAEMKDVLQNRDVLLYFGHGSGGQYIRSRTIKKLDRCAVALLMGCSSGALTEKGDFEPYGTPMNYMHSGSPAILATLWDVTDKDIDRFSQTVLEKWGLFKDTQPPVPSNSEGKCAKKRGKRRENDIMEQSNQDDPPSSEVSLDQAVAQSRDSCILKYLNGAAPVVYGVPVFLAER